MIKRLIQSYIEKLEGKGCIRSYFVAQAFRKVERHRLIETFYRPDQKGQIISIRLDPHNPNHLQYIYSDTSLVTRLTPGGRPTSSSSTPCLIALMLELMELAGGMKVMEIGAGTGYNAALMAELVGDPSSITTLDIDEEVVAQTRRLLVRAGYDQIHIIARDGFHGYAEHAPYDRIVVTAGCPDLSPHWIEQLKPTGFMLIPLQHGGTQITPLVKVWKTEASVLGKLVGWSTFMPVQGELRNVAREKFGEAISSERRACEYSLFEDSLHYPKTAREPIYDFFYFIALVDRRAVWRLTEGVGLADSRGLVLITEDRIQLYGDESLYHELYDLYVRWNRLGRPKLHEYQIRFTPSGEVGATAGETWVIERQFHQQIVSLLQKRC